MNDTSRASIAPISASDRVCVVTGASSGIGLEVARKLAAEGKQIVLLCHTLEGGDAARRQIASNAPDRVHLVVADLSKQQEVRRAADEIGARFERIDALVNNAAVLYSQRTLSEDGIEMQLAVNHLAPYLLTRLLLDRLAASKQGRVLNLSSRVHFRARIAFDDLNGESSYFALAAYGQSKLANVLFTYELARRLAGTAITVNCMHPGLVRTRIGNKHASPLHSALHSLSCLFGRSPVAAGQDVAYLATAPELARDSGQYFARTRPARSAAATYDEALARRLWDVSADLTGLPRD